MTPKEQAKKLLGKYLFYFPINRDNSYYDLEYDFDEEKAKQCALIAVEEIVKSKSLRYLFTEDEISCMEGTSDSRWIYDTFMEYWEEVQEEIKKI